MATGFGFRPHNAAPAPQDLVTCIHLAGDAVLLGKGDAVKIVTGSINLGSGPIVQAVARAASGDRIFGVVEGVLQQYAVTGLALDRTYVPASTAAYVLVRAVTSASEWEVQEDGVSGSVATTNIGKNITMVVAGADTTTGLSGTMAQSSTAATTSTLDLNIRGFSTRADNVPGSTAILVVAFNKIANVDQATGV